jgi:hypothetical protein
MSASEHLSPQQFMPVHEAMKLYSGDFDVPMHKALPEMRTYDRAMKAEGADQYSERNRGHGGPVGYISHLAKDIKANGVKVPVVVRNGNVLIEGHHRVLAAHKAGIDQIPVRHVN